MPSWLAVPAFAFLAASPAAADVVVLQNGVRLEGIVQARASDEITVQVSADGYVILEQSSVVSVEGSGRDANERLRADWARQAKEQDRLSREEERFAKRQRDKGMTQYKGEWLTDKQLDQRLELERLEVEKARLRQPPPAAPAPVVVQVYSTPAILVSARLARPFDFTRRRAAARRRSEPSPEPLFTSSGLLPPTWSNPSPSSFGFFGH